MIAKTCLLLILTTLGIFAQGENDQWPSHHGPQQNYQLSSESNYPISWSVHENQNILWKVALPETGGGNVAVWGDKVFITCFKKIYPAQVGKKFWAAETVGYCYDAKNGKLLWQAELPGERPNQINCIFTDSTTPTPVTDGKHVWFFNAGGYMACYTIDGQKVWGKKFEVRTKHSAKQFQPFLYKGHIYYAAMRDKTDPQRREQTAKSYDKNSKSGWPWMFIRRYDALTGEPAGVMADGISVHSRPALATINGETVILHGKGGGHYPPEKPFGLTLSKLDNFGEKVSSMPDITLEGSHFIDTKNAYTYDKGFLKVLSLKNGQEVKNISLTKGAVVRRYNENTSQYEVAPKPLKVKKPITHRTNIGIGPYQYFMSYATGFIGRVNTETEKVEYLQVPLQISYEQGKKISSWTQHKPMINTPNGIPLGGDKRIKGNGFGHVTAATPVIVNNKIYFTTMLGTVYVIDALAPELNEKALLAVNDLGLAGQTWTLASMTPAQGKIYHRTAKELICIKKESE